MKKILFTFIALFGAILFISAQSAMFDIPGANSFTVPTGVTSITVRCWGGGGGSGGHGTASVTAGGNGDPTTFPLAPALSAGGGNGSAGATNNTPTTGGMGGVASGGTINDAGIMGTIGTYPPASASGGNGGTSPNGGVGGTGAVSNNNGTSVAGTNGSSPGGGAGGSARRDNNNDERATGGGGSGAYVERTYTVTPGQVINFTVGAGGIAGTGDQAAGGAGANGRVMITYTCPSVSITGANTITCPDPMPVTFTSSLTGATSYQWQRDGIDITTANLDSDPIFAPVTYSGFDSDALTITTSNSTIDGFQYQVVVTNTGCPDATSNAITLAVNVCGLPIELTTFSGKQVANTIHLGWETATEKDNDYMEVQRSQDGKRFEALQPVQSKAGDAGTSLVPLSYTFIDEQPLPGINYYRIKQVDLDGAFEYHKTIAVLFKDTDGKSEGVTVFPTLTNDQLNIALATEATADGELFITNLAGQVVLRRPFERGMQQDTLDVQNLPQGQYFITIQTGRTVQNARFVKK